MVENTYDIIMNLFKTAKPSTLGKGQFSLKQKKDLFKFPRIPLVKSTNRLSPEEFQRKREFPYENFLRRYLKTKSEYAFVLFPFSIKFRKSTVVIKIYVRDPLLF